MTSTCKQRQPDTLAYIDSYCFQCSECGLFFNVFYTVFKQSAEALVSWYFLGSDVLSSMNHQNAFKAFLKVVGETTSL